MIKENQKKLKIKTILSLVYWVVVTAFLLLAGILFLSKYSTPINLKVFNVGSGSMEPHIKTGSLVFVSAKNTYSKGEVITFSGQRSSQTFTHRIVGTVAENGDKAYITKGDANNSNDPNPVPAKNIVGKVSLALPYLGYLVNFVQSQIGFTLLVIIPLTLIIYHEFHNLKNETKTYIEKKKTTVTTLKMSLIFVAAFSYSVPTTYAFLSDREIGLGTSSATSLDAVMTSPTSEFGPYDPLDLDKSEKVERKFKITNNGEMTFEHSFHTTNLDGDLCEKLKLRFYEVNSGGGKGAIILSTSLESYASGATEPLNFGLLATDEFHEVIVDVSIQASAGPEYKGTECSFDLESRSWDPDFEYQQAFYDTENITNYFKTSSGSTPIACEIGTLFVIGDIETAGSSPPHDEFNFPGVGLGVEEPAFDDPFVVGTSLTEDWPWNSNKSRNYATDFDLEFDYEGDSGAKAVVAVGWGPGSSASENKEVWVDGNKIGDFTHNGTGSTPYGGLFADETSEFTLINGTNTINLKHTSGDGSFWDFASVRITDCLEAGMSENTGDTLEQLKIGGLSLNQIPTNNAPPQNMCVETENMCSENIENTENDDLESSSEKNGTNESNLDESNSNKSDTDVDKKPDNKEDETTEEDLDQSDSDSSDEKQTASQSDSSTINDDDNEEE